MYLDSESIRQTQRSMGRMPQTVYYSDHRMTLCWMRLIKGPLESLLTTCTKHTVYEIEYALRGSLTLQVDDAQVCIDEGQFLVIPPETSHQIIESKGGGIKFIVGFSSGSKALQINPHEPIPETPAIRGIVEQMCDAGLDAAMQLSVGKNVAEVRVTIPIFTRSPR